MPRKRNDPERNETPTGIKPAMESVAVLLASGVGIEAAGRKVGVSKVTVHRWINDEPRFKKRIAELREQLTDRALGRLARALTTAINALLKLCREGETESIRLKAADALLTHGVKVPEATELRQRIAALEERAER